MFVIEDKTNKNQRSKHLTYESTEKLVEKVEWKVLFKENAIEMG